MSDGDERSAYELSQDLHVEEVWEKKDPFVAALKTGLLGALCGTVITVFVGFTFGGWATSDFADERAADAVRRATLETKVSVCVGQFLKSDDWTGNLRDIRSIEAFSRPTIVANRGWATMPGARAPNQQVAAACAKAISRLVESTDKTPFTTDSPLGGYLEHAN